MKITEIKIRKTFDEGMLKAVVSITFDDCFTVHDVKIVSVNNSFLVVMPNRKNKEGKMNDICHPINREFRKIIEEAVLNKYSEQSQI